MEERKCQVKGEVQLNNNAIWKVRGDNTNEHGIIVFINSAIEMKNISLKVFSYTLCSLEPDLMNIGQGKNSLDLCQDDSLFDSEL